MRQLATVIFGMGLALSAGTAAWQMPAAPPSTPGTAFILGRVVEAGTNSGVPGAGTDTWRITYGAEVGYDLEDRVRLGLSMNQYQLSMRWAGESFVRGYSVVLGVSYALLRGFDAPGLIDPVRPLN